MKIKKKIWMFAIALTLFTVLFTLCASAETVTGTCGDNISWSFDTATGELTISGTGAMSDYSSTTAPWKDYNNQIVKVKCNFPRWC